MSIECLPRKLFSYIDLFFSRKISCEKSGKPRIAVFRSGGLGDLVLLTSLLVSMRGIFKDSKISLICDESHGDIYNFIDEYVDAIVTFDGKSFRKNVLYRWKFLKLISACSFDIFLHTGISRQQGDGDIIARSSNAKEIIGYKPRPWHKCEKEISDRWFTRLIDGEFGEIHELKRLKKFSDIFKVGDNISDAPPSKTFSNKTKTRCIRHCYRCQRWRSRVARRKFRDSIRLYTHQDRNDASYCWHGKRYRTIEKVKNGGHKC